ncbi:hypothetical protein ElyMa_001723700 [Elysia marginata]|uniref:Uncharacterized protein n=1 Tax=Elysia marginata TaxID=1093978 RepID=A0AAV4JUX7_9GAST|nr:hypothetical protein ElyMa_001723700 [Elysia marginata]
MFKATKLLNQKHFENPKVEDREGKLAPRPNDILEIVSSHFKNKFQDEKAEMISPFQGQPKPLEKPITPEEVRKSFNSLNNNKAPEEEILNAFHRKQLKKILNIKFPVKITNKSLYKKCQEKPLSLQILESRWKLFGHILRRQRDIPANKATRAYFIQCGKNHRGRPRTTLPTVLNRDLALIDHEIRLHSSDELDKIIALAQDRRQWHEMTVKIERAAEASQTEDWDAPRH